VGSAYGRATPSLQPTPPATSRVAHRPISLSCCKHVVIEGGPEKPEAWGTLTALLDRSWRHAHGAWLKLARLAIDTGYEAPAVYAWARR
jgi:hypothetical protein